MTTVGILGYLGGLKCLKIQASEAHIHHTPKRSSNERVNQD